MITSDLRDADPMDSAQPPPPPPLPPSRAGGVLSRIIKPLTFSRSARPQHQDTSRSAHLNSRELSADGRSYSATFPQTLSHRTGIAIAAIDINEQKTHAVLAGKDILRTVRIENGKASEDANLRSAINASVSAQQLKPEEINKRRDFWPAKDVRWSHGQYQHIIATAAHNGRVSLFDASLGSSRVELAHIYHHTSQVNKLDFDPHRGYMLLSGSQDKSCKIWDIRDPRQPAAWQQYQIRAPIRDVRWNPNEAYEFALCTESGIVQKWDIRYANQAQLSINAHDKACYTIAWHPDGRHLASGGGLDKQLRIWDFKSENKRQKPVLQLRAPQGILNLAWRPAAWSPAATEAGILQSTQIATTYTEEDPRLHIWDLRRPHIPFRELDSSDRRATDLLWATKDLLWTVNNHGVFTQTDVRSIPQLHDQISPSAFAWLPNDKFVSVTEDRGLANAFVHTNTSAPFLNVPAERLSGTDEGAVSRSLTDDEGSDVAISTKSRQPSRAASMRSAMSQANTPPSADAISVLPLDTAVSKGADAFVNGQMAAVSALDDVSKSRELTTCIANAYARPLTAAERLENPNSILDKLSAGFERNAVVCEVLENHIQAQSWRMLAAAIIPELKSWGDKNRGERLEKSKASRTKDSLTHGSVSNSVKSPFTKVSSIRGEKSPMKPENLMSSLFRGVVESDHAHPDLESTSNVTTPLAKAVPRTPTTGGRKDSVWFTLNDAIEPMQPLPPSIVSTHKTAAMASRALLENPENVPSSPSSSPEKLDEASHSKKSHKRSATTTSDLKVPIAKVMSHSPTPYKTQEERRDAIRDYKAFYRTPFSFDTRMPEKRPSDDCGEGQIPFFSTSNEPSSWDENKESFGTSLEDWEDSLQKSPRDRSALKDDGETWSNEKVRDAKDSYWRGIENSKGNKEKWQPISRVETGGTTTTSTDSSSMDIRNSKAGSDVFFNGIDFSTSTSDVNPAKLITNPTTQPNLASRPDTQRDAKREQQKSSKARSLDQPAMQINIEQPQASVDSLGQSGNKYVVHLVNPASDAMHPASTFHRTNPDSTQPLDADSSSKSYIASDFRPISLSTYDPSFPFPLSAYPLIASMIDHDVETSGANAQFAVSLILLIHDFFFHRSVAKPLSARSRRTMNSTIYSRLLDPALSSRTIEGILLGHIEHLKALGLHVPAAMVRNAGLEFGYESLAPHLIPATSASRPRSQSVGDSLQTDPYKIKASCRRCQAPLPDLSATRCRSCDRTPRSPCPICESLHAPLPSTTPAPTLLTSSLWLFCPICGHSAHTSCMTTWLLTLSPFFPNTDMTFAQGQCPTPTCTCDCAPGTLRDLRIHASLAAHQAGETLGSISGTNTPNLAKKDSIKAGTSPAAERARANLRGSMSTVGSAGSSAVMSGSGGSHAGGIGSGGALAGVAGTGVAKGKGGERRSFGGGSAMASGRMAARAGNAHQYQGGEDASYSALAMSTSGSAGGSVNVGERRVRLVEPEERVDE